MKLGIGISVDVVKLKKELFYAGKNGAKYVNLQTFIDTDNQDDFGNNGGVKQTSQEMTKEQKQQQPFVGNAKVFYKSGESPQQGFQSHPNQTGGFQPQQQGFQPQGTSGHGTGGPTPPEPNMDFDDDIPF